MTPWRRGLKLTVPHRFDFGSDRDLVGDDLHEGAWDALRTQTSGDFALQESREEWEAEADARPELKQRAEAIHGWLGDRSVASYGAGTALLELWLARLAPARAIAVTDYTPTAVALLRELFPEARVERHDLLADRPLAADVHLFHRIDTEFTDDQWRTILRGFQDRRVLVVAAEVLDLRGAASALYRRARTRGATHAGWLRTRAALEALWAGSHDASPIRLHDLDGWLLEPRRP
jgi:predicted RNA methylase